jgi:hypothetical protein
MERLKRVATTRAVGTGTALTNQQIMIRKYFAIDTDAVEKARKVGPSRC